MLVDSHCHLNYPDYEEGALPVIARAKQAGVSHMLTISCRESEFEGIVKIAELEPAVYATIGIHPHDAKDHVHLKADDLLKYAVHPKVIGFGETGLDYYYDNSPRELQRKSFETHIEAASQASLPLIVHTRDAEADTAEILESAVKQHGTKGLLHCFTSSTELALKAVDLGFYISFSGILTFKKSEALRETARALPLNKILVETDAPFLAPEPHRGKRNEPAYTVHTAKALAELKGISFEEVARTTTENFFTLFNKAKL